MKKFELTEEFKMVMGRKLFRIKALVDFSDVKAGDLGGFVEKEENLDHDGNAWVGGNACVRGNAWIRGDAWVGENACVEGNARVGENARVEGSARVRGDALVGENARIGGNALVGENARVRGDACVGENARVRGFACVEGNACVGGNARVRRNAWIRGDADYTTIKGFGSEFRTTTFFRQKDGTIGVVCGCFCGNIKLFREKVKNTHGTTKFAKEYLMIADLMEMHFDKEENKNEDTRNEYEQ